jgi:hypothetical protein
MTFSFSRAGRRLPRDRRLGQHAGGLLEGGRRDERLGRQRRLGDAEQHGSPLAGILAVPQRAVVLLEHARTLELLALEERVSPAP